MFFHSSKRLIALVCCLAVVGVFIPLAAQSFDTPKLDSLFDQLQRKDKAMGSICVSKNGKVLYTRSIGAERQSNSANTPATAATKYRIGSITKMFTAAMIFQLIEEKKLSLETHLSEYYTQVPNADRITIEQLLGHRSGIHNFTNDSNYMTWKGSAKSHEEMLRVIASNPSDFAPGEKMEYSNSNYVLLGYIVEKVTGHSYSDALQQRVCQRIGLVNTRIGSSTERAANESDSYRRTANGWEQSDVTDMSVPGGAGAIISTPTELTKFIEALFDGRIVSQASLAKMSTFKDNAGLGMFRMPMNDRWGMGHTGGIDGFSSIVIYFKEDSLAVAYCSNGVSYGFNNIMIGALSIAFHYPYTIPEFATLQLNATDLDKYLGNYSSTMMPLKISVTKEGSQLMAQATGQSAFPLTATKPNVFVFEAAGIEMIFDPANKQFTLKQGGGKYLFSLDK